MDGMEKNTAPQSAGITLTEKAAEKIKEIRASQKLDETYRLRVRIIGGGCSGFNYDLSFDDTENPGDKIFNYHGVGVIIDQMSFLYVVGTDIDYVDDLVASGFKFGNPNVKSTCGCGSSFQA